MLTKGTHYYRPIGNRQVDNRRFRSADPETDNLQGPKVDCGCTSKCTSCRCKVEIALVTLRTGSKDEKLGAARWLTEKVKEKHKENTTEGERKLALELVKGLYDFRLQKELMGKNGLNGLTREMLVDIAAVAWGKSRTTLLSSYLKEGDRDVIFNYMGFDRESQKAGMMAFSVLARNLGVEEALNAAHNVGFTVPAAKMLFKIIGEERAHNLLSGIMNDIETFRTERKIAGEITAFRLLESVSGTAVAEDIARLSFKPESAVKEVQKLVENAKGVKAPFRGPTVEPEKLMELAELETKLRDFLTSS